MTIIISSIIYYSHTRALLQHFQYTIEKLHPALWYISDYNVGGQRYNPADTRRWINVVLTLVHRLRRWTYCKPTLIQRPLLLGSSKQCAARRSGSSPSVIVGPCTIGLTLILGSCVCWTRIRTTDPVPRYHTTKALYTQKMRDIDTYCFGFGSAFVTPVQHWYRQTDRQIALFQKYNKVKSFMSTMNKWF